MTVYEVSATKTTGADQGNTRRLRGMAGNALEAASKAKTLLAPDEMVAMVRPLFELEF